MAPRIVGTAALALAVMLFVLAACNGNQAVEETSTPPPDPTPKTELERSPGVFDSRIVFGQSAAFSGPAQALGTNMRLGILAAFHEANEEDGVHGRTLELTSLDDAYEPEAAVTNTMHLIDVEEVFALIGEVGTPTSRSATPVAADAGIPFIAPFTGAEFLRDPEWSNIINLRASYYQETEEMVSRLITDLGIQRIAVLYQDDSYGRAGWRGVRQALDRRGMEPVSIGLYPRNTTAVKTALLDLEQGAPEAVIMIGAYEPVAALIKWARHTGMDPIFMTVSFVGSNALAQEARVRRRRGLRHPGSAVPDGRFVARRLRLPRRPGRLRPGRSPRLRLLRGLPGWTPGHRRARQVRPGCQPRLFPRYPEWRQRHRY